jgi:urocanate hydratase
MSYQLVVGSQARILYSDQQGRVAISLALNELVRQDKVSGPIVISRDHHDVSGTDSPFRETSNVYDGSVFTAGKDFENCFNLILIIYIYLYI